MSTPNTTNGDLPLQMQPNGHGEAEASTSNSTLQDVCADINKRVTRFLEIQSDDGALKRTQEQTQVALSVIDEALKRYDFDTLSLSYNGGKDCLVLLIIYLAALHRHFSQVPTQPFPRTIPSIYAKPPDPFPQVSTFVHTSTQEYYLDLVHISTNPGPNPKYKSHANPPIPTPPLTQSVEQSSTNNHNNDITTTTPNGMNPTPTPVITFRDAFAMYLKRNPQVQAIFVGTRRTDPHGAKLTHFDMTDGNWPRFMRIHPVIDWRLSEIWTFLKHPCLSDPVTGAALDYCTMYDQGYTSLGGVEDTLRNPRLKYLDEDGTEKYKPAYKLTEDGEERLGRE